MSCARTPNGNGVLLQMGSTGYSLEHNLCWHPCSTTSTGAYKGLTPVHRHPTLRYDSVLALWPSPPLLQIKCINISCRSHLSALSHLHLQLPLRCARHPDAVSWLHSLKYGLPYNLRCVAFAADLLPLLSS